MDLTQAFELAKKHKSLLLINPDFLAFFSRRKKNVKNIKKDLNIPDYYEIKEIDDFLVVKLKGMRIDKNILKKVRKWIKKQK